MKLTKNFSLGEFACKDKAQTPVPEKYVCNVKELAKNLQIIRDEINAPIHLNSAYRTKAHNIAVDGEDNSQHLEAKAADMATRDLTPKQLHTVILRLIKEKKIHNGGVGLYKGFVHYDIRPTPARW